MAASLVPAKESYTRSHPFLTFEVAFRLADPMIWMLLGEAQSKCDHIALTPLLPGVRQELEKLYLAKGLNATTAIEGNTLTEEQVRKRVEGALPLPPSREYLGREVDNIHRAIGTIPEIMQKYGHTNVTPDIMCEYNRIILDGLDNLAEEVEPGVIRNHDVTVGGPAGYIGAPARDCPLLVERLCQWLASPEAWPRGLDAVSEALLKAVFAHLYIAWIHPFGDGNGRTARLIEVHILAGARVPRPVAHLLSNHYNQTRSAYYAQLDGARRLDSGPLEFLRYALQGIVDGMKEQLLWIQAQVNALTWMQFVYATFHSSRGKIDARRREVALALLGKDPATTVEIRNISAAVAGMYGGKTDRAVARDLGNLREKSIVVPTDDGKWRANLSLLVPLFPARAVN